jgi:hypothetical protein
MLVRSTQARGGAYIRSLAHLQGNPASRRTCWAHRSSVKRPPAATGRFIACRRYSKPAHTTIRKRVAPRRARSGQLTRARSSPRAKLLLGSRSCRLLLLHRPTSSGMSGRRKSGRAGFPCKSTVTEFTHPRPRNQAGSAVHAARTGRRSPPRPAVLDCDPASGAGATCTLAGRGYRGPAERLALGRR